MSFFKLLFGSPETAVKTAGVLAKGVDYMIYTDQEKADNKTRAMDWLSKYMEATQGQNLARRLIAMIVTLQWALLVNTGVICQLLDAESKAAYVFKTLDECVNEAFGGVMLFYFAAGAITRAMSKPTDPPKK